MFVCPPCVIAPSYFPIPNPLPPSPNLQKEHGELTTGPPQCAHPYLCIPDACDGMSPFTQSTGQLTIPAECPSFYDVRQVVDNTTTHVFTKADFVTYYESTETGRPVSRSFTLPLNQPTVRPPHRPVPTHAPSPLLIAQPRCVGSSMLPPGSRRSSRS